MTRCSKPLASALALALSGAATGAARAAGFERWERAASMAVRPSRLAARLGRLVPRRLRLGVPVDCGGAGCGGSAPSPSGAPSTGRDSPNDRRGSQRIGER